MTETPAPSETESCKYLVCTAHQLSEGRASCMCKSGHSHAALTSCETHPRSSGPLKAFTALSFMRLNAQQSAFLLFPCSYILYDLSARQTRNANLWADTRIWVAGTDVTVTSNICRKEVPRGDDSGQYESARHNWKGLFIPLKNLLGQKVMNTEGNAIQSTCWLSSFCWCPQKRGEMQLETLV